MEGSENAKIRRDIGKNPFLNTKAVTGKKESRPRVKNQQMGKGGLARGSAKEDRHCASQKGKKALARKVTTNGRLLIPKKKK